MFYWINFFVLFWEILSKATERLSYNENLIVLKNFVGGIFDS